MCLQFRCKLGIVLWSKDLHRHSNVADFLLGKNGRVGSGDAVDEVLACRGSACPFLAFRRRSVD